MPTRPYKNVRQISVTLPADLADQMEAKGLKPSALLRSAVETALTGADPGTLAERVKLVEKGLRQVGRNLSDLRVQMDAARALAFEMDGSTVLEGPIRIK